MQTEQTTVIQTVPLPNEVKTDFASILLDRLKQQLGTNDLSANNIFSLCITAMQYAETTKQEGSDKKELVISTITQLIEERNSDMSLVALIPAFIDSTVSFNNGDITLNVDPQKVANCLVALCCGGKDKNNKTVPKK